MSKTKFLLCASLITLFTACGNDDKKPEVSVNGYNGIANDCSPGIERAWHKHIGARCNRVDNQMEAQACLHGAHEFRQSMQRFQGRGLPCSLVEGDDEGRRQNRRRRPQRVFEINDAVLNEIFARNGWVSLNPEDDDRDDGRGGRPGNDGRPGHNPGFPGGPQGPGPGPRR